MRYQTFLPRVLGSTLLLLFLVGCGAGATATPTPTATATPTPTATATPTPTLTPTPVPKVEGSLLNASTGEPLSGARVILCAQQGQKTACVIDASLSGVTDDDGEFSIPGVQSGKYVLLYNVSGESQAAWDGMALDYTPQDDPRDTVLNFLGVDDLVAPLVFTSLDTEGVSGVSAYLYSESLDLAFIWMETGPISVIVENGFGRIDLAVWDTVHSLPTFDPLR
jgi:hypothetical protein